jgi:ubiquinone/menaquinone biosynthesis C-methylase UbiE
MLKKDVENFFDSIVEQRINSIASPAEAYNNKRRVSMIIKSAGMKPKDSVLDTGCGSGEYLSILESNGFLNLHGMDISTKMLRDARYSCKKSKLVRADAESMPFFNDFFDSIIVISVIQFLPTLKTALMEFKRILKPNGKLAIIAFNEKGRNFKKFFINKDERDFYAQPRNTAIVFTRENIEKILLNADFKILKSTEFNFIFSRCPAHLLPLNIFIESFLEKTPLRRYGKEILIIAEKAINPTSLSQ